MRFQTFAWAAAWTLAACGDDGGMLRMDASTNDGGDAAGATTVSATARFVKGASVDSASLTSLANATNGRWTITPNSARATLYSLDLFGAGSTSSTSIPLSGCNPEVRAADPRLAQVLACDIEIPIGEYAGIGFSYSTTFEIVVDDNINGIYSDPSAAGALSSTPPTGGAAAVQFTIPGFGTPPSVGVQQYLAEPWLVTADGAVISVMTDTVHTVFANFDNGPGTIDNVIPNPGVLLVPSPGGAGRIQLYSGETSSADNAMLGGETATDSGSVRLYFATPDQPSYVFYVAGMFPSGAWAADPAVSPETNGSRAGGYLGLDTNGYVCWAVPKSYSWQQYEQVCRMQMRTTVGQTTAVECQTMTSAPAPVSGGTYASGCPSITPTSIQTLTLIAD